MVASFDSPEVKEHTQRNKGTKLNNMLGRGINS